MDGLKNFLFISSNIKQTIIKNIVWLSVGLTVSRVLRSLIVIYAARILGIEGYGVFAYTISFVAIFNIFSDIGLTNLLTRELVQRNEADKREYLATSLAIKIFLVMATTAFIATVTPEFTNIEEAKPIIFIMAFLITFDGMRNFFYAIYRSQNRMHIEAIFEIISEIFITSISVFVLFKLPSVENLALSYLAGSMIGFVIVLSVAWKYVKGVFTDFNKNLVVEILRSAWPFAFLGIFGVLMTNIDSVIMGFLRSTKELGILAAAQKPISMLYLIPGFIYTALFPTISKLVKENDEVKLNLVIRKSLVATLIIAFPIVFGGIAVASPFINVVFGYDYIEAVTAFQILLLSLLIIFPGMIWHSTLLALGKQNTFVKASIAGALTNVILDLILIAKYGVVGSAVATLSAQLAMNGVFWWVIRKYYNINIASSLWKICVATVLMLVVVEIMKTLAWPLLVIIALSAVIYFLILFILKEKTLWETVLSVTTKNVN